jgi:YesN/AraC family two-component response regulator
MNDFSLLLTDFRMPIMSGIDLACEVRKLNGKIKIVLITAFIIDELQGSESYILAKIV